MCVVYENNVHYSLDEITELKMRAMDGDTESMLILGNLYFYGEDIEQDWETSFKYRKMAADKGSGLAYFFLGTMYYYGDYVEKNYATAKNYFLKASLQGVCEASLWLGKMYYYGNGVEQDYKSAFFHLCNACKDEDCFEIEEGYFCLWQMYDEGLYVKKDDKKAKYYMTKWENAIRK